MYYNVVISDSSYWFPENQIIFHFGDNLQEVIDFCKIILETGENCVQIIPISEDDESEESEE